MKTYAKVQNYKWDYTIDKNNEMADAFGANRTPECLLFNRELKLVYYGAIDGNPSDAGNVKRKHIKKVITEIIAVKEVTHKESKSVGAVLSARDK